MFGTASFRTSDEMRIEMSAARFFGAKNHPNLQGVGRGRELQHAARHLHRTRRRARSGEILDAPGEGAAAALVLRLLVPPSWAAVR
jgi:hypothetical protein